MTVRLEYLSAADPCGIPIGRGQHDAIGALLAMQHATTAEDAHNLAMAAILAGATGEQAQQAINEWAALQARQVQQVFAAAPRRDCCTGVDRQHGELPQTADITDYLRLKGEL